MSITVPEIAETYDLDALLEDLDTWFHLYVTRLSLGRGTLLADFTEASWPAYQPLRVTTWSPSQILRGRAWSSADPTQWTRGSGGAPAQVYGYYVTDGRTGPLLWCESRQQGPTPMTAPTDMVVVLPRLTLRGDDDPE